WSLHLQRELGLWGLAVFAFVLTDALAWYSHWCHHKVATLWRFHAVHHSQQRLNALSDNRTHVGEVVAAALIVFVPSQVLGLDSGTSMGLAFIGIYYSAMLHSNIRTNLGPLKYVFLGPQPHRVHHAVEPRYFDHNFGTVFPWWDFMAGTYYWGVDEYPPTGITDPNFPLRVYGDLNPWCWVGIFIKQLVYPFVSAYQLWVSRPGAHAPGAALRADEVQTDAGARSRLATQSAASGAGQNYLVGTWPTPMAATWSGRGCRRQLPGQRVPAGVPRR
ncbi:MAG TPA: sterol desaturase family protein, partial [Acidimicrobiales bacterium]|nr:sterol desaturase family protein [Acidimicrobiales bacterium]